MSIVCFHMHDITDSPSNNSHFSSIRLSHANYSTKPPVGKVGIPCNPPAPKLTFSSSCYLENISSPYVIFVESAHVSKLIVQINFDFKSS